MSVKATASFPFAHWAAAPIQGLTVTVPKKAIHYEPFVGVFPRCRNLLHILVWLRVRSDAAKRDFGTGTDASMGPPHAGSRRSAVDR